ncbi:hypothetical protein MMC24_006433 [Lignoscripta atroalba]|nr:hypothetical protein [Lignoscripta atroalba]
MFSAVMGRYNSTSCLGGRSMGARAAVMAAEEETKYLILASYPLHTEKEMRDQILLDLPSSINVIFISGDADSMCDLERLEQVRRKMSCRTWRIVVQTADHGMNVKPKQGTREVGMKVGEVVAGWVRDRDDKRREGVVSWEDSEKKAVWSGWCSETERSTDSTLVQASGMQSDVPVRRSKNAAKSSKRALVGNLDDEAVSSRTRNKKKT